MEECQIELCPPPKKKILAWHRENLPMNKVFPGEFISTKEANYFLGFQGRIFSSSPCGRQATLGDPSRYQDMFMVFLGSLLLAAGTCPSMHADANEYNGASVTCQKFRAPVACT